MRATHDHITASPAALAETLIAPALRCGTNCITDGHRPEYAHALNCDLHGDDAARCLTYLQHTDKGRALLTTYAAGRPGAVVEGLRNHLTDLFRAAGAFTHHVDKWTRTSRGRKVVHDDVDRALFKAMVNASQNGHPLMYPVSANHGIGSTPWVDAASLRTKGTGWTGAGGDDGSRERVPLTGMFGYAPAWVKTPASVEMTRDAADYLRDQAVRFAARRDRKNPAAARRDLLATLTALTTQQAWERLNAMIGRLEVADPQRAAAFHAQRERAGVHGSTTPAAPAALTLAETRWLRTLATDLRRAVTTRELTGDPDELGELVLQLAGSRPRPDRWAQLPEPGDPARRDQFIGELLNHLADQLTADQAAAATGRR